MRILLAVKSCLAHRNREIAILETWGSGVSNLFFFDGQLLHCPDDYESLYLKTQAMCRWAAYREYDYLCMLDTDTYCHVPRLLASGFENYDYSGFVRPNFKPEYCYGPCYWLSRKAFTVVANGRWTGEPYEDVMVGSLLHDAGIFPHHDDRYSHWFPVSPDNDKIIHHLNSLGGYSEEEMYAAHAHATGQPLSHR